MCEKLCDRWCDVGRKAYPACWGHGTDTFSVESWDMTEERVLLPACLAVDLSWRRSTLSFWAAVKVWVCLQQDNLFQPERSCCLLSLWGIWGTQWDKKNESILCQRDWNLIGLCHTEIRNKVAPFSLTASCKERGRHEAISPYRLSVFFSPVVEVSHAWVFSALTYSSICLKSHFRSFLFPFLFQKSLNINSTE